ncbi:MAG: transglycosylase domain-containing protein [Saprospiraceae bacterium]|jgi:penicillin-binding protein 1A|nr:transglycosylase domain-containing protein [Saprospiraceae bacterium]
MATKKSGTTPKPSGNQYLKWLIYLLVTGIIIIGLLFYYISKALLPDTAELENPKYEIASQFISADNLVFGKIFKYNREWLDFKDINPNIVKALIATEDVRFYSHVGIDIRGTARALFYLGSKGGASTITQQLAKLFFTQRSSTFHKRIWQKLKEWVIAIEFEKRYTKEEILAMYLNKSDFLFDAVGIGAAAKTYFGKDQKDISIEEAAVLIAMLKNPRLYNPKINPQNSHNRRSVVLKQMVLNGFLTDEEYLNKRVKPINLDNFRREAHHDGIAPYFRAELTKWVKTLLEDEKYHKPDGSNYNLYTDGLKIYTTIDTRIQKYAEQAMYEHMSQLQTKYFERWKGKDFMTYKADKTKIEGRKRVLIQMMKESDRYKAIRSTYMSKVFGDISSGFNGLELSDTDIFRCFEEENTKGHLQKLAKSNFITQGDLDTYTALMKSEYWAILKSQWNKMQNAVNISFNTKTKMIVFAYNDIGEKVTEMTPLDSIKYHLQHLQIGSVSVDPKTGHILSWVGGIGHKYFQYDHVNSNRQVGSTFKPFIYSTAIIDNAMSPCYKVQDVRQCIEANDPNFHLSSTWCPSNSDNKFTGQTYTLRQALKDSKNSVSVFLMKEIGNVESVKNLVGNLGIDKNKIPNYPSICLGTPELSAMDMACAYTGYANEGIVTKPIFVTRIEDKNGRLVYSSVPEQKKAINPAYNYVIVDMLKYVASIIQSKFKSQVAGKTGTTNDYKDGWFVGFTPEIVISTWVGGDQEFIRFNTLADGQGAVMARPFFEKLLTKIENDNLLGFGKNMVFMRPEEELIEIDCSKYETAILEGSEDAKPKKVTDFDEEFHL